MTSAIEIRNLTRIFGKSAAVSDLSLTVRPGTIHGFFGRNGAGKTTTIRCLLNLLRPTSGSIRLFGLDPVRDEVAVKRRLGYVPDAMSFYPWMTVRETLDYFASFRERWDKALEAELLERFDLDPGRRACNLSKGQSMLLALATAICPGPELLILDEPTAGLDPINRREFLEAVIGAYQDGDPEHRTVFLSTHLISEVEGIVDDFTIIDRGTVLTSGADDARSRFRRVRARFAETPPQLTIPGLVDVRGRGREREFVMDGHLDAALRIVGDHNPESLTVEALDIESIFLTLLSPNRRAA
jgi:ABC-2 type transport system ATP-binding protein